MNYLCAYLLTFGIDSLQSQSRSASKVVHDDTTCTIISPRFANRPFPYFEFQTGEKTIHDNQETEPTHVCKRHSHRWWHRTAGGLRPRRARGSGCPCRPCRPCRRNRSSGCTRCDSSPCRDRSPCCPRCHRSASRCRACDGHAVPHGRRGQESAGYWDRPN